MTNRTSARFLVSLWTFFLATIFWGCARQEKPADLVLINGKIVTVEAGRPAAEALAIRGDQIAAVEGAGDIKRYIGKSTRVIDLRGRLAIPGFIDSHGHLTGLGEAKMILDLTAAKSLRPSRRPSLGSGFKAGDGTRKSGTRCPSPTSTGFPFTAS
jgi:imidazolonepropionase-like amidohydrolase